LVALLPSESYALGESPLLPREQTAASDATDWVPCRSLSDQLAKLESALAELRTKYTDQHPRVQLVKNRIDEIKGILETDHCRPSTGEAPTFKVPGLGAPTLPRALLLSLCDELALLESELARLTWKYTDEHPRIQQVRQRVTQIRAQLGLRVLDCNPPEEDLLLHVHALP
jgi:capsule polysaccharide export protein KpsE/RkpR